MEARESSALVSRKATERTVRKASDVKLLIRELAIAAFRLGEEIAAEEKKTGVSDPKHVAYSLYAKALVQRRENLIRSIEELSRAEY
jgi:hypothetical protein